MAPWVRKTFIDFLPKFLFIERPTPAPPLEDQPNAEHNAGFNIVFPETLEERNSVSRLLNHAQYDGGGFRSVEVAESLGGNIQLCPQVGTSGRTELHCTSPASADSPARQVLLRETTCGGGNLLVLHQNTKTKQTTVRVEIKWK